MLLVHQTEEQIAGLKQYGQHAVGVVSAHGIGKPCRICELWDFLNILIVLCRMTRTRPPTTTYHWSLSVLLTTTTMGAQLP